MAEVKWIKLVTNIFDNRKIRQIETMPEGDSIIVIWMKLLCLAGNINDKGLIYFTPEIPYTEQMLAAQFNRPITTVQLALKTFVHFGMIEIIDDIIFVSSWEKYQNVDGMEKIREQTRKRVAKHRENKLIPECNVTSNVTVTQCNATEEEKEKEIEIERDNTKKNKEKENSFDSILSEIPDPELRNAYLDFIKMRKTIKSPMTERALRSLIKKVEELEPGSVERQKMLLDNAILNNWKSVYPLKDQATQQQKAPEQTATNDWLNQLKSMYQPN